MREPVLAGMIRGLVVGIRVAVVGVIVALIARFLTPTLNDYIQIILLAYWGLALASLAIFWVLTAGERKQNTSLYGTSTKRLWVMLPMVLVAVILGTLLFIGYATTARFAPSFVGDEIPRLYNELFGRIAGLPFIVNLVIGLGGAAFLANQEPTS